MTLFVCCAHFIWLVPLVTLVTGDCGGGDWWCWCDKGVIRTESSVCWYRPMQIRVEGQTFERQIWEEMKTSKLNLTQSALCHPTAAAVKSKCLTKGAKSEKPNITGEIRGRQMPSGKHCTNGLEAKKRNYWTVKGQFVSRVFSQISISKLLQIIAKGSNKKKWEKSGPPDRFYFVKILTHFILYKMTK